MFWGACDSTMTYIVVVLAATVAPVVVMVMVDVALEHAPVMVAKYEVE